jgi:hypothetical protein
MSTIPPKADIVQHDGHVRFVPIADMERKPKAGLANAGILGITPSLPAIAQREAPKGQTVVEGCRESAEAWSKGRKPGDRAVLRTEIHVHDFKTPSPVLRYGSFDAATVDES